MSNEGKIEVINFRLLPGNGPIKALVDIRVGDWEIYEWRIHQANGQRAQVLYPHVSRKNKEGHVRYRALLSIPGELRQRIEVAILSAWEEEKRSESHR